jgi:hypothetical protein
VRSRAGCRSGSWQAPSVTQNGGEAKYPKHTSGPLAEATGGRLHVFEGLGPNVACRWPIAMNIVLREFLEDVRSGALSGRPSATVVSSAADD